MVVAAEVAGKGRMRRATTRNGMQKAVTKGGKAVVDHNTATKSVTAKQRRAPGLYSIIGIKSTTMATPTAILSPIISLSRAPKCDLHDGRICFSSCDRQLNELLDASPPLSDYLPPIVDPYHHAHSPESAAESSPTEKINLFQDMKQKKLSQPRLLFTSSSSVCVPLRALSSRDIADSPLNSPRRKRRFLKFSGRPARDRIWTSL